MPVETVRFAAVSCSHAPVTDSESMAEACEIIREHDPHYLVHLGDAIEADSASRFDSAAAYDLLDEHSSLVETLRALEEASPNARRRVLLDGNHEYNLLEAPMRIDPKLRRVVQQAHDRATEGWHRRSYGADRRYRWCLGQVIFRHGAKAGQYADRQESLLYGEPYCLHIMGHTHRPRRVTQVELPGNTPMNMWYANPGCLADWDRLDYTRKCNTEMWGHGVVIGECKSNGEGLLHRRTREWDAETVVVRAKSDER